MLQWFFRHKILDLFLISGYYFYGSLLSQEVEGAEKTKSIDGYGVALLYTIVSSQYHLRKYYDMRHV